MVTYKEFNSGVFGVPAPVFNAEGMVVGSLGIAAAEMRLDKKKLLTYGEAAVAAAKHLSDILSDADTDLTRAPRAFDSGSGCLN